MPKKNESPAQRRSRKINQTNFVLCGIRENLRTQRIALREAHLPNAASQVGKALESILKAIDTIAAERKPK